MEYAKWYFTHESAEDRLWYGLFFSMCKKFHVSWPTATPAQKAFTSGNRQNGSSIPRRYGASLTSLFPPEPNTCLYQAKLRLHSPAA